MSACSHPLGHELLVAYWANDLGADDLDAVELHLFGCAACTAESARIARLVHALGRMPPPVIAAADLAALRATGLVIIENRFEPGERRGVVFEPGVDLLVHRLSGLALRDAERVEVVVRSEAGERMAEDPLAPFDRERGEVLIACQRHFAAYPHDVVFDVRVFRPDAAPNTTTYFVPHDYRT